MDDDEVWLQAERDQAGACPSCGAAAAQPIFYGMPDVEVYSRLFDKVFFTGCLLPEVLHRWSCTACGAQWGEVQRQQDDEPVGSPFDELE